MNTDETRIRTPNRPMWVGDAPPETDPAAGVGAGRGSGGPAGAGRGPAGSGGGGGDGSGGGPSGSGEGGSGVGGTRRVVSLHDTPARRRMRSSAEGSIPGA